MSCEVLQSDLTENLLPSLRHKVDLLVRLSIMLELLNAYCASCTPDEALSDQDVRASYAVQTASTASQTAIAVQLS